MFGKSSGKKTMKWGSLLKDLKDKVGLSQASTPASSAPSSPPLKESSSGNNANHRSPSRQDFLSRASSGEKHELEWDFKRYWEEFRSSTSEKEKENALNWTVDIFCRLEKQHTNVAQVISMLVETHIFSFVVGRAFVTDIEKLKLSSKTRALEAEKVLAFFSEITKDGFRPGANLLHAVEILVSGSVDKQSFLDSGILSCLIHVLNALLAPDGGNHSKEPNNDDELLSVHENNTAETKSVPQLEVEGRVVHIMKALASHPSAAQSLIEDNSLQLLFQMVANGSLIVFSQYKEGLVPLHTIQLYRHAMQILGLLLANDNGCTAKYIHKHHLIKVLLMAIKDFNPDCGDPAYTMGIVDLLLECVELSYRTDAGGVRLREDIRNAHGYHFLVQFALTLSRIRVDQTVQSGSPYAESASDRLHVAGGSGRNELREDGNASTQSLSPSLCRLLDVIINFALTGPSDTDGLSRQKALKSSQTKPNGHGRSRTSSSDHITDEMWDMDNGKVKDLEAVQMLQDILIKAENTELQAEVLNRMFKMFSSHLENYKSCQELRTVPLLILNMAGFPSALQDIILKILEYAVTVVNLIPEQELLSLCCLLQQPVTSDLKHTILSFFVKLVSFDQQYKKVLREVGVLEVLLDDLKQHKFQLGPEQFSDNHGQLEIEASSSSFQKHLDTKDAIISSPKLFESGSGKIPLFDMEETVAVAWDCLVSLLKKAEANQASFRSANGFVIALPFIASDIHRPGVLRVLSCLIMEDVKQVHSDELGSLVEILKSGMVISALGSQYTLQCDAKCDAFGALWRILGANGSAQRVFGEVTGFSLLLTTLHSFQSDEEQNKELTNSVGIKIFTYMMRVMTVAVSDNAVNRTKLHSMLSSHTFYELLCESGLICVESECLVIQLFLELSLELVLPPSLMSESTMVSHNTGNESTCFVLTTQSGSFAPEKARVYNAAAVRVLIRALLLFTPKVQLELLNLIEKLAYSSCFNQENLTSIGCVQILLEIVYPILSSFSPLVSHALKVVEVLGAYRLSVSELRILVRYIFQMRHFSSGRYLIQMIERLILSEDMGSQDVSLAPFLELDMSKIGHACIQVPLGERSWPPAAGYSFVCWFQFKNFLKSSSRESEAPKAIPPRRQSVKSGQQYGGQVLRIFSVGAVDNGSSFYAELRLDDDGLLTLATSNSSSLTFSGIEMEEGRWHHLAVVHSKPNALAGLFQASFAYLYLDGKLRHTGKLGYSPSPAGKPLNVTIGTPVACAKVSDLSWKLRSCYLFEEVLSPGSICFMYILGRGYKGLFQDSDLVKFVPNQACGGGSMAILDSLDSDLPLSPNIQNPEISGKVDHSGIVWDSDKLGNLSLQLWGKKMIFAFDGTITEMIRSSGTLSVLNLVDPLSAAASPIGGIPRFGRLIGDTYVCKHCVIGDTIRPIGGINIILALVEAAETRDMLHMALMLLACALHQNPQNVRDMQKCRGYHLLALFLHRRMSLFDMQSLEIFFQIAACEASFSEPRKLWTGQTTQSPVVTVHETSSEDFNLSKFRDEFSSVGSQGDMDDFSAPKDSFSHISELENTDLPTESSNCIVLSNADMVEHVLLDWTLWVTAPVPIQISLLGFLEHLVSMHWYRNHNLTILRRINLVQHLLVTLQRGDVEVPVLEKLVVLLGVILEDGFLPSELELVVRFTIMTFDPPELTSRSHISRESMGKHVIVRNMLLEMLIDLQVTIHSDELLEQWHKIVSSKLITYFLDEAVHPTSMRWIMTLLGVCLASSPTFALKFRSSGGYQGLTRVLTNFYDSPDIYYILFCLMFGKPVYPRLPEVRMLDFHMLMPSDNNCGELKFVELLESAIAMAKSTFDRLCMQSMLAHETGNLSQIGASLVAELVDECIDMAGELQGEALMHKTYAARLMGGEASAPAAATSVLRFMVDLAKICPPFSAVCRRAEFLESSINLYFSCIRASQAVKMAKELTEKADDKNLNDDDSSVSQNSFSSLPQEHELSAKTSISIGSFTQANVSASSEDLSAFPNNVGAEKPEIDVKAVQVDRPVKDGGPTSGSVDGEAIDKASNDTSGSREFDFRDMKDTPNHIHQNESESSLSLTMLESPSLSERSNSRIPQTPSQSPSPVTLTPWVGRASHNDIKVRSTSTLSMESSMSAIDVDSASDTKSASQTESASNSLFVISPKLLLEVDDSGYGGGPCSAGATAILDLVAEVLSGLVTEQMKAAPFIEAVLESAPLYVDAESVLVFQGLCLSRLMIFLERRLMQDDEENEKKLDKARWSLNLDVLSCMIVDRVYMGAFPQPATVLKTLEFLLSMLQLANKDGRIEDTIPTGKGLLSIGRGNRQLEAYMHALLKNMNRMILYCFLPSFLCTIGEDDLLSRLGLQSEPKKRLFTYSLPEEGGLDIFTVLQLLVAHRRIIFCPSNIEKDLNCCLCINLISLLHDHRQNVQNAAVDIIKYLLVHCRAALEEFLVTKTNQALSLDVLHGGFDKLLTGNVSEFFEWLNTAEPLINRVLEQCAAIMWTQYIAGSAKFPGVRIKGMDSRRKREMGKKSRDVSKLDQRHWEQVNERRIALELVRDAMSTELRVIRQDKYGWVLHAESEWQTHLQQLVHDRGIFPIGKSCTNENEPEWQLCPIEGPLRMRKKLERCKLKIDTIRHDLDEQLVLEGEMSKLKTENEDHASDTGSDIFYNLLIGQEGDESSVAEFHEPAFKETDSAHDVSFSGIGWNDDKESSINEASLHSANDFGVKSSAASTQRAESVQGKSDFGSARQSSIRIDEMRLAEEKSDKELNDSGEYLIRPYLEPLERIKHKYNCERVAGLDKHDGIFLIGELSLYVIENFYIDDSDCICEKDSEDELSVIDKALGVKMDSSSSMDSHSKPASSWSAPMRTYSVGRAWAYNGGAWGMEKVGSSGNVPHLWRMWKLDSVHELLKRDYQLRPVAIEIFSMDGCNDLLVFHKKEREEVFKNLVALNLPRNSIIDATLSGSTKQDSTEGSRLFKVMGKSITKRWQNGEISNFQYIMYLNTLAGRGYSDLTQYPVFPWVLADYESENLDLSDPKTFRVLEKPMGCQTREGEEEFRKRYESWDDPDVPKFHYGSHYSSAGIVLFYLLRLAPFSTENQKLQGGQFDHADRLFNSVGDTWLSAAGKGNTSDVKELIPEFFYMPEFLENRFNLDLGEKQSGEKVDDVILPPWAKGSAREFIRKHREALESDYVSEHLHHWIDLIFGYKQRGKAAEEAVNVFYHYTYEGSVDIDSVTDPAMKASILAQINHFGQTPKQLFLKPHVKRRIDKRSVPHPLRHASMLVPREIRKSKSAISQIVTLNDKILIAGANTLLKPRTFTKYVAWSFPDRSLRFIQQDQDKLLSTHENLHGGNQIQSVSASHDGQTLVTGADDGLICVWRISSGPRTLQNLQLERALCGHTGKISCLRVSQPYMIIVSGSDDCTVIIWDLSSLVFIRQLPEFPSPVSAIFVNDLTGEIVTAAGVTLAVWSINGDCLAVVNTSQLPSDFILSLTGSTTSDWLETNWYVSGHQSGAVKVWKMVHSSESPQTKQTGGSPTGGLCLGSKAPEYRLILQKVLKAHKSPVTSLHLSGDLKQLLSGDSSGHLLSWTISDEALRSNANLG
ncbi:protein SPIRRIG [Andrographis paniculata]|uniref:protein SPIRRIG n=1 Tax=Andrographis paniculata TaxID=175694 RepID=UPI0021E7D4BB|nr:protein SPIRRIG [Andrographis paniculata]